MPDTQVKPKTVLTAAAVAIVLAGVVTAIVMLVNANTPATMDYQVKAHGNMSAHWAADTGAGQLDMYTGDGVQTIRAASLDLVVSSTMPSGAGCEIRDAEGRLVDAQSVLPRAGASGLDASTSVTCKAPKR